MPTGSTVFVDTAILVYAEDGADETRQRSCHEWLAALWERRLGRISTEVLNEYYVAVTRKIAHPLTQGDARAKIRRLQLWQPWQVDHQTVETAWAVEARLGLDYWDALIVASASQCGCGYLLTDRLQHGVEIGAVTTVNPFRVQAAQLLPPNA